MPVTEDVHTEELPATSVGEQLTVTPVTVGAAAAVVKVAGSDTDWLPRKENADR